MVVCFLGSEDGVFTKEPLTYKESLFNEKSGFKPTSLAQIPNKPSMLSVSFGSPLRYTALFTIIMKNGQLHLENFNKLSVPIIENGYSPFYVENLLNNNNSYIIMFSLENNKINSAFFDVDKKFQLSHIKSLSVKNVKPIIGTRIKKYLISKEPYKEGLIIPFMSGDSALLFLDKNDIKIEKENFSEKIIFTEKK